MPSPPIEKMFRTLAKKGEKAYMPYVCMGYPTLEFSIKLIETLARNGADLFELGIPFSDPIADGPTIQRASQQALANRVTPHEIFEGIGRIRSSLQTPFVLMTYGNIPYAFGVKEFFSVAKEKGIAGIILPDVPLEEGGEFERCAKENHVDFVRLCAPSTPDERIAKLAKRSKGFLYLVSVKGTTGARTDVSGGTVEFLKRVKREAKNGIPLAVGFGIANPSHVQAVRPYVDGIIEGSALVSIIEDSRARGETEEKTLELVAAHAKEMKGACCGR